MFSWTLKFTTRLSSGRHNVVQLVTTLFWFVSALCSHGVNACVSGVLWTGKRCVRVSPKCLAFRISVTARHMWRAS